MIEEQPDAETAFIVIKKLDGSFIATPSLDISVLVERKATRQDIKYACNDLLDAAFKDELSDTIVDKLTKNNQSESEKTASSIRQALSDKGIM